MATIVSDFSKRYRNTIAGACAGSLVVNPFFVDLKTADLVANNVIDLGILPAGHTIHGAVLAPDDLDTGATLTLDVGIMSGVIGDAVNARTVGTELYAASTAAQTGVPVTASTTKSAHTIPAAAFDRSIGVKIVGAPTGATAGRLRLVVSMYATDSGFQF